MTAPINILAAALDKIQHEPATCSMPSRAQAEHAALLVIAQSADVEDGDTHHSSSVLLPYVKEVERAKEALRKAMDALDSNEQAEHSPLLREHFDHAQDVYYQAAASVAELITRLVLPPRIRPSGLDSVWAEGYF